MTDPRTGISRVCADPATRGQQHHGCSGGICICPCHGVRLQPGELRARVQAARKEARTQAQDDPG